ncbi:hypothetical protein FACS1894184_11820 [Clostridia bacterium]|nr:hypothetical protein FACS1894184_11820 [Clostridia bacterium]
MIYNLDLPPTATEFHTDDAKLQRLYDSAVEKSKLNLKDFGPEGRVRRVLIEGGGYHKIWLETQPMGGLMFAGHDLTAAINNVTLFMEHQRDDGRLPGSIEDKGGHLEAQFNKFQGFCFPAEAVDLLDWVGNSREYVEALYDCLLRFDAYLWRTRDSNGDGCLESWCITDTGEDGALRYGDAPFWWTEDRPPEGYAVVPIQSMDVMWYSVSARDELAWLSIRLGNGQYDAWRAKANAVRKRIFDYLWNDERGACFDRDKHGSVMPTLLHNNLRVMYGGGFSQRMADRFVSEHLLNPDEFWTPTPLPSVAANDPLFRNESGNNWSGQPEGLTFQRSIRALENYGYDHLLAPLFDKLATAIGSDCMFTQQYDPFTSKPSSDKDGYGPTMLAVLGFIGRLHGILPRRGEILWGVRGGAASEYKLTIGDNMYELRSNGQTTDGCVNGKPVFKTEHGFRVVTDKAGTVIRRVKI